MAEQPKLSPGLLSSFRHQPMKSPSHRWDEAIRVVSEVYGGTFLNNVPLKAVYHEDHIIARVIRLLLLTHRLARPPKLEDLRKGDISCLAAIDLFWDQTMSRQRHTFECMVLGSASNSLIADYMGMDEETVQFAHDVFFNVRDKLDKPLQISDMVFTTAFMQGGIRDPAETEKIVSYMCGCSIFLHYRFGTSDSDSEYSLGKLQEGLLRNQAISALLRRSTGYESTQQIVDHLHQQIMLASKQDLQERGNEELDRLRSVVEDIGDQLGLQVAERRHITDDRKEGVHQTAEAVEQHLKEVSNE